jgi:dCTP deaminase
VKRANESHRGWVMLGRLMSVLTRDVILNEIAVGRLTITPLEENQVGVASIDLTLGDEIRQINPAPGAIDIAEDTDYRDHTTVISLATPYVLHPGETIHGITRELVELPSNICGFLEGRSRYARLGLMIHVTSAFVQPGVENRQVLELSNVSAQPLRIHAGVRICQLVLMRTEGNAVYSGRFQAQHEV